MEIYDIVVLNAAFFQHEETILNETKSFHSLLSLCYVESSTISILVQNVIVCNMHFLVTRGTELWVGLCVCANVVGHICCIFSGLISWLFYSLTTMQWTSLCCFYMGSSYMAHITFWLTMLALPLQLFWVEV